MDSFLIEKMEELAPHAEGKQEQRPGHVKVPKGAWIQANPNEGMNTLE